MAELFINVMYILLMLRIGLVVGSEPIVFVTNIDPPGIYMSNLGSSGSSTDISFTLAIGNIQLNRPVALDYDPNTSTVYWSDVGKSSIERYSFVTEQHEVLVSFESGVVDGLAVDGTGEKLYWTSTVEDRIEVINLDGTNRTILFDTSLDEPRAIEIDTTNGYLYWTDWGSGSQMIERAQLNDSSTRTALVTTELVYPNGLVLSVPDGKMYWCDAGTDRIEEANLDGTNRRTIISVVGRHPFDIEIYGNYLYWSDWTVAGIYQVDRRTGISSLKGSDSRLTQPGGLCIIADFEPPTHCSVLTPRASTCVGNALEIGDRYTKSTECVIKWSAWMDASGVSSYDVKVCKMIPSNNVLDLPKECTTLNVFQSREEYEARFNPTSPGVYCVVLSVNDTAANSRNARRCLIFDNQSEISIAGDSSIHLTVDGVKYNNNSGVQIPINGNEQITLSWKDRFYNELHVNEGLLFTIKIDDVFEEAYDSDAPPTGRPLSAISNKNGIVRFEYAVTQDGVTEVEHKWELLPNDLDEMVRFELDTELNDKLTFWVQATDVIGNRKTDFVSIHTDPSEKSTNEYIIALYGTVPSIVFVLLLVIIVFVIYRHRTPDQVPHTPPSPGIRYVPTIYDQRPERPIDERDNEHLYESVVGSFIAEPRVPAHHYDQQIVAHDNRPILINF
ncbi:uncharacterized protein [Antedon mediterranea]|uniref:uncharacterized protein n=1 Tax=Antedon mediterranea TaxID=105859 RepID=UPI003AF43331